MQVESAQLHQVNRVSSNGDGTDKFLKTINSCLDICSALVDKPVAPLCSAVVNNSLDRAKVPGKAKDQERPLVSGSPVIDIAEAKDKGGTSLTLPTAVEKNKEFDPSNPDTWPES